MWGVEPHTTGLWALWLTVASNKFLHILRAKTYLADYTFGTKSTITYSLTATYSRLNLVYNYLDVSVHCKNNN